MIKILLLLLALIPLSHFCLDKTHGFTILGISSSRPHNPEWETRSLSFEEQVELESALSQPYTYFGCGGQSYIFFSQDGNYVLKFFKQRLYKPPVWLDYLPSVFNKYKRKKRWKRSDKLQRDFSSYKIAFEELPKESALLYIHLNKTAHLKKTLTITDPLKIAHELNLDEIDFVLQKRGVLAYDKIDQLMRNQKEEEAKKAISALLALVAHRCQMGLHDRDPNVRTNCGFIGEQPMKIDVGRIMHREEMKDPFVYYPELVRISTPFAAWLKKEHPTLLSHLQTELARYAP